MGSLKSATNDAIKPIFDKRERDFLIDKLKLFGPPFYEFSLCYKTAFVLSMTKIFSCYLV